MLRLPYMAIILLASSFLLAQNKPSIPPDPVKYINKFEIVWETARDILNDLGFKIELEDRARGRIVTKPQELIAGALTASELDKVATKPEALNASWLKARYAVEMLVEIVQSSETLVTVRANIEALKRDLSGEESWLACKSNGSLERRILGKLSTKLLSPNLKASEKKGFWDRPPQPVASPKESPRPLPVPDRERP